LSSQSNVDFTSPLEDEISGKAQLMEHLCKIADENACGRVDWLVSMHNENGQKFYESIGATISEKARLVRLNEEAIKQLAAANV
jgi:ribosomal protein S18 acetylase RimI-like enzyme